MAGRWTMLMGAAVSAAMVAAAPFAAAQPAPPPPAPAAADQAPVDPAKLALARKLLDMQMAQMNLPQVMKAMDEQIFAQAARQGPGGDPALQRRMQTAVEKVQAEMLPEIMDAMAAAFARNLTDRELADTVAFYSSPSGQAILHKMPAVMGEVIGTLGQWIPRMRQAVIQAVCSEGGCTPAQREALEHPRPPGERPPNK